MAGRGRGRPAIELLERALIDLQRTLERHEHVLRLAEVAGRVAVGETAAGNGVELRRGSPRLEHADDAHVAVPEAQGATHAVFTAEKLVVEIGGDHCDARALGIVLRRPRSAILERHREHRKEIRGGGQHGEHQGRHVRLRRRGLELAVHDQRLAIRTMRAPQIHRRPVVELVGRLAVVAAVRRGIRIHLRIEQVRAAPGQRIAGKQVHHRQRGHGRADAHRDRQHHQHGEHAVALQAAQREVEVVAEHSTSP